MVRFSGPCKTIPVRHSGGPLGLTLTLTGPNSNLTITLTPGMADLRNGGPPEWGPVRVKHSTAHNAPMYIEICPQNYLKLGNNSAVPFRSRNYHILVKSGTQFRSVPEIIRSAVLLRSVDYHILVKSGTRRSRSVPPFRSVPEIITTLKTVTAFALGVRFVFRTLSLFKQLQMNNSLVDNEHADDSYVIVTVLLFH